MTRSARRSALANWASSGRCDWTLPITTASAMPAPATAASTFTSRRDRARSHSAERSPRTEPPALIPPPPHHRA
jgi:hypothetical protein